MELASELKLPVVIHDRDAHMDTLDILKEFPEVIGTIHCFSGSVEFACGMFKTWVLYRIYWSYNL